MATSRAASVTLGEGASGVRVPVGTRRWLSADDVPACFPAWQWRAWRTIALRVAYESPLAGLPCVDCEPDYQAEQHAAGTCANPHLRLPLVPSGARSTSSGS